MKPLQFDFKFIVSAVHWTIINLREVNCARYYKRIEERVTSQWSEHFWLFPTCSWFILDCLISPPKKTQNLKNWKKERKGNGEKETPIRIKLIWKYFKKIKDSRMQLSQDLRLSLYPEKYFLLFTCFIMSNEQRWNCWST